jgi:predicted Co/Zn/Cd cation transporter (cation efflux family)
MSIRIKKRIQSETKALHLSMYGSVFFVIAEIIMALSTSSQSILMDAAYGAADLLMIIISIRIIPFLYRPTTEKHPFGHSQMESIFITIKGAMLTAVTVGLVINSIQVMLKGGNHIPMFRVAIFELIAAIICGGILFALIRMNRKLDSPIVKTEIHAWIIDTAASFGLFVAFILPSLIQTDWMDSFTPYLDQVVAIILAAFILPMPIRMVLFGLRDIFLWAPDLETVNEIKEICQEILVKYQFDDAEYDIIKTGRKLWISIYFKSPTDQISVSLINRALKELEMALKKEYADLYVELIPE